MKKNCLNWNKTHALKISAKTLPNKKKLRLKTGRTYIRTQKLFSLIKRRNMRPITRYHIERNLFKPEKNELKNKRLKLKLQPT